MMNYLRQHLSAKLLLSYLIIVLVGIVILFIAVQVSAPFAYNRHMMGDGMMGPGRGPVFGPGDGQGFINFRAGIFESVVYAAIAAVIVAIGVALFFSRRIVAPLRAMTQATQRISAGHYAERVLVSGEDELAQLADQFNDMAGQLEQVESMRRQLIGDVSHELRTPLTAIKGYMEGLEDGLLPMTAETFQQVHQEAERLSRLVDDLQELSRVEAKAYQLDLRLVNISEVVTTTLKRLTPSAQAKGITLQTNVPADLPNLNADNDRLIQVLTNLVGNALQYTPTDGLVKIAAAAHPGELQIAVSDTGVGISAEHLPHIFDRFYRVDKSRSRQTGGGSGIGLTVAKHLVEAHGGRLWVESKGDGQGSTFIFTLPL